MNWIQNMNRCVGPASWDASKGNKMTTLTFGGRCEKHLSVKPCQQCAAAPTEREALIKRLRTETWSGFQAMAKQAADMLQAYEHCTRCKVISDDDNEHIQRAYKAEAVLDALAISCIDASVDTLPKEIMKMIIEARENMAVLCAPVLRETIAAQDEETVEYWKAYAEAQTDSLNAVMIELKALRDGAAT